MLNRAVEATILPFCEKNNIGVINYAPMHSGLLTGAMNKQRVANFPSDDFRRNAKNYQEPLLSRNLAVADFIGKIGHRHGVSAGVVAIAWTLHHSAITAAIVGGRNAKQVEGVIPAATFRLSEDSFPKSRTISPNTWPDEAAFPATLVLVLQITWAFRVRVRTTISKSSPVGTADLSPGRSPGLACVLERSRRDD